jgi:hypothetical protein
LIFLNRKIEKMKITKAVSAIMFMSLMAVLLSSVTGVEPLYVFGGLVTASVVLPHVEGALIMGLQVEIWQNDILDNLFKGNEFATRCKNRDSDVLAGAVVHTQDAGVATAVKKNITIFPQAVTERVDSTGTYAIDTYYALPRRIANLDTYELSYEKRQSVVGEDTSKLIEEAMDGLLYRWAPTLASNILVTTGASTADDILEGATGTRKLFNKAEFQKAVKKIKNTNNKGKLTALLTTNHYYQLLESFSEGEKTAFHNVANLSEGVIGRYYGVDVIMRSTVNRYRKVASVWTPLDISADSGFVAGAGDSAASMIYEEMSVERAVGSIDVFDNQGRAEYYGDIYSAMLRFGGRKRRVSGVYAIVEEIGV